MSEEFVTDGEVTSAEVTSPELDPIAVAGAERDEFKALAQRIQADFENYKKRVSRDIDDAAARGGSKVINAVLPVLDAFDLAVGHFGLNTNDEAAALLQSRQLLLDSLAKEGLERLGIAGEAFDPQIHDAVMHIDDEGGDQIVDDVLRCGYRWKGVVLRPAMVRVKG